MQFRIALAASLVAALAATGLTGLAQAPVELKVGDTAPAFTLKASDGKTYSLADFKGKSTVVLSWFPKAFTAG